MNMRKAHRAAIASGVASVPVIMQLTITAVWRPLLPDQIATTFGPNGSPSGYANPTATATLLAALQLLFLTAAIGSAFAHDQSRGRISCAVTTAFVAALATSWLVIAGRASSVLTPAAWWTLVIAPAWGLIPFRILRNDRRTP